ncbi:hypothetical protein CHH79_00375 [Bacillus siamensis]|nr:hypothetical protein CHH79_00375 [Bacillus siamensis]
MSKCLKITLWSIFVLIILLVIIGIVSYNQTPSAGGAAERLLYSVSSTSSFSIEYTRVSWGSPF